VAYLFDYLTFLAKAATLVLAVVFIVSGIVGAVRQAKASTSTLYVQSLNERFRDHADVLYESMLTPAQLKRHHRERRREEKREQKSLKLGGGKARSRIFVLDFDGDLEASAVEHLREEISAVLQVAEPEDEILVRLESEGGLVHGYGLAASQLARIRGRGLRLTVAVDKVAASGGYLMACVADRIIAAPFAILGSIGVVAQLPNFHRLLDEHKVDFELHTAGQHKRTLTLFGENTDEARAKFREELDETHALFKSFVTEHRPQLAIDAVATGEHWFGTRALELKLVDEIKTSDDYLLGRFSEHDLYSVRYHRPKRLPERLQSAWSRLARGALGRWNPLR